MATVKVAILCYQGGETGGRGARTDERTNKLTGLPFDIYTSHHSSWSGRDDGDADSGGDEGGGSW